MSELASPLRVRRSVFAKLVAIMFTMAAVLLALVTVFVLLYLGPLMDASIEAVVQEYVRSVATNPPSHETAREIARRLDLQAGHAMRTAHLLMPAVLLLLMGVIVFATHGFLKRLLLPVRLLGNGVAELGERHLDVVVPKRSDDEFGALTDAFNRMVRRVKDMVDARNQLLLDVSHELRSPLTRLKVALELVRDPEMKRRMVADLVEMEIMIGELLELERLRDGRSIDAARHDVVALLSDVARNYDGRPPGVLVAPTAFPIFASIDAERIRIVMRNLLENAFKYSLPDSRPVEVRANHDRQSVIIRVIDDGPGVPAQDMSNLFEPFFRVDRSRSKRSGGYGLGLSIAKRIVEAHGGAIGIENHTPRGASFIVTLPAVA